jgi:hypothetical protein
MTIDELQGSLNYALRKCFTDARYKLQAPITVQSNDLTSSDSDTDPHSNIGQKLSQSSGSSQKKKHIRKGSPASPNKVVTARPYHSIKDEDRAAVEDGSGGSNSDEIVVMSDDGENTSDEIEFDGDTSVEL